MPTAAELLTSIQQSGPGLTLGELLKRHPDVARRSAQRWISQWIDDGDIVAQGRGRARRYVATKPPVGPDALPDRIPLSADSRDILAYVDQPLEARKPVGYQPDFLDAYEPNQTWYLSLPLRRQLRKMGETAQGDSPAGTYNRAILNRLLIDLSWASSHLEGNTYCYATCTSGPTSGRPRNIWPSSRTWPNRTRRDWPIATSSSRPFARW